MLGTFLHATRVVLITCALVVAAALAALLPWQISLPVIFLCAVIALVVWGHEWLWYLVVALVPFVGIIITFATIPGISSIPIIGAWDAPLADVIVLPLLIVSGWWMLRLERIQKFHHHVRDHLPGIHWYAPFFIVTALTVLRAPDDMKMQSVQYLLRFVLFSYLAYVALPYWLIDTKQKLTRTIYVLAWSGIVVACIGAISLFVNGEFWGTWRRVAPFAIGSFAPLGYNHNLLAEVLVYAVPFAWLLSRTSHEKTHRWYMVATVGITLIALLTFARAAWIALAGQALLAVRMVRPTRIVERMIVWWPLLIGGMLLIVYMIVFSSSDLVASSTTTRIDLTRIALQQASITPLLGKGVGTFYPTIGETRSFILDYGAPIEAHGLIQKLLFEVGIIGLSFFVLFFGWLFITLSRQWHLLPAGGYRDMVLASLLSVWGAWLYQLFNTSYFSPKLWLPVGISLVILFGKWKFTK